jgi:hypothetical protein
MSHRRLDRVSLVAGIAVLVVGGLLMLDQGGDLEVSAGVIAATFIGAAGLILLVSGLFER